MRKTCRKIYKAMNMTMGVLFIVSGSAVDSESWIPLMLCAISVAYHVLMLCLRKYAERCSA